MSGRATLGLVDLCDFFLFTFNPLAMPPKKRQKTAANSKVSQPQTVSEVAPARMSLREWIGQVYQGRHGFPEQRKWPLLDGGTFLDMVQRVWSDEDNLQSESLRMVQKLGIMDSSATEEDFQAKYLTMKDSQIVFKIHGMLEYQSFGGF